MAETQRPRGRPRAFEEETVLQEALELFWKQGAHNTTLRNLERALGVNQSSLYNVFGSKEQLLSAALDRYEALTLRAMLEPLEHSADGLEAIRQFFRDLMRWVDSEGRRGCMLINIMAEDGGATEKIKRRTLDYRLRVKEALRRALQHAARRQETWEAHIEERTEILFGMVLALNIAARGGAPLEELERLMEATEVLIGSWQLEQPITA